jgi:Xaa-Pro aminopeptidase
MPNSNPGFTSDEYDRRWASVRHGIAERGFDALVVTAPTHIQYLTGHDAEGAYAAPYFLLVPVDRPPVLVVRLYDERKVIDDLVVDVEVTTYYGRRDACTKAASAIESRDLATAGLGLELDHWGMAPADADRLRQELGGATFGDGSGIVDAVSIYKSQEELTVMREAARLTDLGMSVFYDGLREGVSEIEVARAIDDAAEHAGGQTRPSTLLFGARSALPHGFPSGHQLADGDVAFIEMGVFSHGYTTGLTRTAICGSNIEAERLHDVAEEATQATLGALRPGAIAEEVHATAYDVVDRAGRGATFRQRTGYGLGINWYARGHMSLEPGARDVIQAGMTFHLPRILFDESGAFGVGTSESVLITDAGPEIFSKLPRSLRFV